MYFSSFWLYLVVADSKNVQVTGRGASRTEQRRADRFADSTIKAYLSTNIALAQELRMIHPLHGCIWPPNRVLIVVDARRQCRQNIWIFIQNLKRPKMVSRHYSPRMHCRCQANMASTSLIRRYQSYGSNPPLRPGSGAMQEVVAVSRRTTPT